MLDSVTLVGANAGVIVPVGVARSSEFAKQVGAGKWWARMYRLSVEVVIGIAFLPLLVV
ncbi:hypothetical protein BDN70DRAFT_939405 [Pholiota conissans]|uniref:Uncharacterized protein n=1 Tax=Pholiota conissans TaxID=109636 RepID=A0A9P5YLL0_9AGAR|nr:hypothetical protein BDN70DRAFT_939405 [Pholiota conissans]